MTGVSRDGQSPFAQWELVEAEFVAPDTATPIAHHLVHVRPEAIRFLVVGQTGSGSIYEMSRASWSSSQIVLAASNAPLTVTLLIVAIR